MTEEHGRRPARQVPSRVPQGLLVLCVLTGIMGTVFLVLTGDVWRANHRVGLDRTAANFGIVAGEEGPLGGHTPRAELAERLGSRTGVGLAAAALFGLALLWRQWVAGLVSLLSPVACFVLIEYVAKPLINQPIPFGGRAYPSGHAAGVTAVALRALILLYRRWGALAAILFAPLGVAAIVSVGLGVLALEFHHYPTDVVGGAALAGAVVLTLTAVLTWATHAFCTSVGHPPVPAPKRP